MEVQAEPSLVLLLKLMNGQPKQDESQLDPWDKGGEKLQTNQDDNIYDLGEGILIPSR